jgi:hypothetical protein
LAGPPIVVGTRFDFYFLFSEPTLIEPWHVHIEAAAGTPACQISIKAAAAAATAACQISFLRQDTENIVFYRESF